MVLKKFILLKKKTFPEGKVFLIKDLFNPYFTTFTIFELLSIFTLTI